MFTSRIETLEGNFIALEDKGYGEYIVLWVNSKMNKVLNKGIIEDWLWACSSWEQPLERGEWDLDSPYQVYNDEFEEKARTVTEFFSESGDSELSRKEFVNGSFDLLTKIKNLPSNLQIIEEDGDWSPSNDGYGGRNESINPAEYKGKKPCILKTSSFQSWRGNSSRGTTYYYHIKKDGTVEEICSITKGDGFGIVKYSPIQFSFEKVYNATHPVEVSSKGF